MAVCKFCRKEIVYIKAGGKMKPVNPHPVRFDYLLDGPDKVITENGEILRAVISEAGAEIGYRDHSTECTKEVRR